MPLGRWTLIAGGQRGSAGVGLSRGDRSAATPPGQTYALYRGATLLAGKIAPLAPDTDYSVRLAHIGNSHPGGGRYHHCSSERQPAVARRGKPAICWSRRPSCARKISMPGAAICSIIPSPGAGRLVGRRHLDALGALGVHARPGPSWAVGVAATPCSGIKDFTGYQSLEAFMGEMMEFRANGGLFFLRDQGRFAVTICGDGKDPRTAITASAMAAPLQSAELLRDGVVMTPRRLSRMGGGESSPIVRPPAGQQGV